MCANINIKVCGMRQPNNITAVAQLGINRLGLIFYPKSKRFAGQQPTPQQLKALQAVPYRVGVFVNADAQQVLTTATKWQLTTLQLHGLQTPQTCQFFKQKGFEVWKSFGMDASFDFARLPAYAPFVDAFLFDTASPKHGGTGQTFDWQLLQNYNLNKPFWLAGGIGLEQADKLPSHPMLAGVDVNSRFETEPALKDIAMLSDFLQKLKKNHIIMSFLNPTAQGFYGSFGGAYIPEMLVPNIDELRQKYLEIIEAPQFKAQFNQLLKDYVGRPTPLYKANRLSEQIGAQVYLKREDLCHTGAHKVNNTIGQILLARHLGKEKIIAETGAGQHGVATATVCALMGMECIVYMGELDIERQKPNVERMRILGAEVRPATCGSRTLKDATNEAMRHWLAHPVDTHYIIGSVVGPHPYPDMVARFQSVISHEMLKQIPEQTGKSLPDYVVACVGGGSNAAGAFYHFLDQPQVQLIAVEAAGKGINSGHSAATTALGKPGVLHGSKTLLMQTADGQVTEPYSISAGLDYPGIGPMHAHLFDTGRAKFMAATDTEAMEAGLLLCRLEGIIPAIETAHALAALHHINFKPTDVVVLNLSGRGDKDLQNYITYKND